MHCAFDIAKTLSLFRPEEQTHMNCRAGPPADKLAGSL